MSAISAVGTSTYTPTFMAAPVSGRRMREALRPQNEEMPGGMHAPQSGIKEYTVISSPEKGIHIEGISDESCHEETRRVVSPVSIGVKISKPELNPGAYTYHVTSKDAPGRIVGPTGMVYIPNKQVPDSDSIIVSNGSTPTTVQCVIPDNYVTCIDSTYAVSIMSTIYKRMIEAGTKDLGSGDIVMIARVCGESLNMTEAAGMTVTAKKELLERFCGKVAGSSADGQSPELYANAIRDRMSA